MILLANSVLGHVIPAKAGIQGFANVCYVYIEGLYNIMNRQDNWIPAFAGMTCCQLVQAGSYSPRSSDTSASQMDPVRTLTDLKELKESLLPSGDQ
jgi:hypothetical protein